MEKFKPLKKLSSERLDLFRRTHCHDIDMWDAINESRTFLREYLFWVDGTKDFSDVYATTDLFTKFWNDDVEWCYAIYRRSDNKFLGCIGAHNINFRNQSAELGYWLRQPETGNGYMTEAVKALEEELFKQGLHRLTILCDVNNTASANVATRAGYELESIAKEALFHYTGLHSCMVFVKFSPYPITGF